jgi:predicted transglutaminase-like cysteine proteinase
MAIIRLGIVAADHFHLRVALEGLTAMNRAILRVNGAPPLYESGVVYKPEKPDHWETLDILLARGFGDCEDLSAWRAAELQEQGIDAHADLYALPNRPGKWHAIVVLPDGTTEDPSLALGMRRWARRRRRAS